MTAYLRQVHALLARGGHILDESFGPAFREGMIEEGALLTDW